MNRIDDILDSLQGRQPVLTDSEELTARIMANLPDRKPRRKTLHRRLWMVVRTISTLAAAWLIGLFIYQQLTDQRALQGSTSYAADLPHGNTLKDAYLRSLQKQRQTTLSYTFVKQQLNENH